MKGEKFLFILHIFSEDNGGEVTGAFFVYKRKRSTGWQKRKEKNASSRKPREKLAGMPRKAFTSFIHNFFIPAF